MVTVLTDTLRAWGRFGIFTGQIGLRLLTPPWFFGSVIEQTWMTCSRCLGPVIAVNFPFGSVLALQGLVIFDLFGAQRLLSSLVSVAVLRELAPVLASVLVAAQGGSSCAAELGAMRIKEELDATEVMAIDGLRLHAMPRVIALTIAAPTLYVFGAVAGLAGSYLTAVIVKGEPAGVFLNELWLLTAPIDVWAGVLKTTVFGAVIGLIAAFHGYYASGGAAGVGRAVNQTVVRSVLAFITINYLLTSALYGAPG
ncbi:MAG: ABC transporter permease [Myxococcota bacterium]|nr:ABC transporter permease [Myxococcota bacterium]